MDVLTNKLNHLWSKQKTVLFQLDLSSPLFFYVQAMCKRCTRNGQAVRCNLKRGNDVSKWHEKYNFSCRSNINKFDTNQLLPKEKRTSLEQQIRWQKVIILDALDYNEKFASIFDFFNPIYSTFELMGPELIAYVFIHNMYEHTQKRSRSYLHE